MRTLRKCYCAILQGAYSFSPMTNPKGLPDNLNTAHEVILVQSDILAKQKEKIDSLHTSLQVALAEIRFLRSGRKREKFINANQLLLEFPEDKELQASLEAARKEAEEEVERITYTRKKQAKPKITKRDSFPDHLPREEIEVVIPGEFQQRIDSGELVLKRHQYTETLKHNPAKLVVLRYKQPVLAFTQNLEKEILVDAEANLGDKSRYHPSVAAQIVNGKFGAHLPYYRLQDIFASSGWTPNRSTLDYVTDLAYEVTQDLPKLMLEELKKSLCIGIDDTQVKLIMPKEIPDAQSGEDEPQIQRLIEKMKEAKKANQDSIDAKMWGYSGFDSVAPYDVFDFRVSRHRDGPKETLAGYEGHVMADCYSGNLHVILAPDSKMTRMACWSHARRKVYECQHLDRDACTLPLALMNQLYDIERRASQRTVEARAELRSKESRAILERLKDFLDGPIAQSVLPAGNLGKAFNYLRNHWDALTVYTKDGRLPIDNNQVERLMKRVAIGRKNWLFIGSLRAGIRNASLMSLVASALRMELDVSMYLESVITHRIRGTAKLEELLPDRWRAHHPEAVREYREQERRDKADVASVQAAKRRARSELRKKK